MTGIRIRDFDRPSDYQQSVGVQKAVWGLPDLDVIPSIALEVIHRNGGVCIGAFDGDSMAGFVFGLVGREGFLVFHHSHMLAVLPAYRGRGLGEELKWAQRDRVLAQELDLVRWTYDPLQAGNAHINIHRLGAMVGRYLVNVYGESASPLHGALPTDRFEAEWWIGSPRVQEAQEGKRPDWPNWEELPRVNRTTGSGDCLACDDLRFDLDSQSVLVRIPPAITSLMARNRDLALDWRLKTRQIFQSYLGRGYAVVGFHRSRQAVYYRLERNRSV